MISINNLYCSIIDYSVGNNNVLVSGSLDLNLRRGFLNLKTIKCCFNCKHTVGMFYQFAKQ